MLLGRCRVGKGGWGGQIRGWFRDDGHCWGLGGVNQGGREGECDWGSPSSGSLLKRWDLPGWVGGDASRRRGVGSI